ncbi:MAG: stage II sporulation protein M [Bacteroidia bacterium]
MKESRFVDQNNQKWKEFELDLISNTKNPEKKSKLFTQITDDLSFARTFYKNRSVREYLNGVGQLLFSDLNLNERFTFSKFIHFFTDTFPKAMYATRRSMLISLIVFTICFVIGALTTKLDPTFANEILSSGYVKMTEKNIANNDPMYVYKDSSPMEMFGRITKNNMQVAYITFLFGIFSSIGTLFVIMYNGIMVGVFQYFFISKGLFWTSFLTIWTHGTIEISCIIVAGGAGLQLGKGLLFPGTYKRWDAFKMSGKSALIVIAGITPLIVVAGFIESFQTRHTDINDFIRLGFILFCLAFVLFYFFWYPRTKFGHLKNTFQEFEQEPIPISHLEFNSTQIYDVPNIFSFTLGYTLKNIKHSLTLILLIALAISLLICLAPIDLLSSSNSLQFGYFQLANFFDYTNYPLMSFPILLSFWALLFFISKRFVKQQNAVKSRNFVMLLASLIIAVIIIGFTSISTWWSTLIIFFLAPFLILVLAISNLDGNGILAGPKLIIPYLRSNFWKWMAINGLIFVLVYSFFFLSYRLLIPYVTPVISMFLTDNLETSKLITWGVNIFFVILHPLLFIYFYTVSMHFLFYSLKESNTAENLFARINKLIVK